MNLNFFSRFSPTLSLPLLLFAGQWFYRASLAGGQVSWLHDHVYTLSIQLGVATFCFVLYAVIAVVWRKDLTDFLRDKCLRRLKRAHGTEWRELFEWQSRAALAVPMAGEWSLMCFLTFADSGQTSFSHGSFNAFGMWLFYALTLALFFGARFVWTTFVSRFMRLWIVRLTVLSTATLVVSVLWRAFDGRKHWSDGMIFGTRMELSPLCRIAHDSWLPIYDICLGLLNLDALISPFLGEYSCAQTGAGVLSANWMTIQSGSVLNGDRNVIEIDTRNCGCPPLDQMFKPRIEVLPVDTHSWQKVKDKKPYANFQAAIKRETVQISERYIVNFTDGKFRVDLRLTPQRFAEVFLVSCNPLCVGEKLDASEERKTVLMRAKVSKAQPMAEPKADGSDSGNPSKRWNVDIVYIDAVSRRHFQRRMPKSRAALNRLDKDWRSRLNATDSVLEVFGFHSVGTYTKPNSTPLFAGHWYSSRNRRSAEPLWTHLRKRGYRTIRVTNSCEDFSAEYQDSVRPHNGWNHEMIALFCDESYYRRGNAHGNLYGPFAIRKRCLHSRMVHCYAFDYHKLLFQALANDSRPHFVWNSLTEGHEGSGEVIALMDKDLGAFVDDWRMRRQSQESVLVFMSDHGLHMSPAYALNSAQARAEVMMPMLAFVLPPKFVEENPKLVAAFRRNQQRVVNPFDFYDTLLHISEIQRGQKHTALRQQRGNAKSKVGVSMFEAKPETYGCLSQIGDKCVCEK